VLYLYIVVYILCVVLLCVLKAFIKIFLYYIIILYFCRCLICYVDVLFVNNFLFFFTTWSLSFFFNKLNN